MDLIILMSHALIILLIIYILEEYASPANLEVIVNFTTHNTPNVSIYIHFNKSVSLIINFYGENSNDDNLFFS